MPRRSRRESASFIWEGVSAITVISLADKSFFIKLKTRSDTKECVILFPGHNTLCSKRSPSDWRASRRNWSPCVRSHSVITWEWELSHNCGFLIDCFKTSAYETRKAFFRLITLQFFEYQQPSHQIGFLPYFHYFFFICTLLFHIFLELIRISMQPFNLMSRLAEYKWLDKQIY